MQGFSLPAFSAEICFCVASRLRHRLGRTSTVPNEGKTPDGVFIM